MKERITITGETLYHHMPDHAEKPELKGMTLHKALKTLRGLDWGNMGGTHLIDLSDRSWICVECQGSSDGGTLLSSQMIERSIYDNRIGVRIIRKYKI